MLYSYFLYLIFLTVEILSIVLFIVFVRTSTPQLFCIWGTSRLPYYFGLERCDSVTDCRRQQQATILVPMYFWGGDECGRTFIEISSVATTRLACCCLQSATE